MRSTIAVCLCLMSLGLSGCVRAPIPITPVVHTDPKPEPIPASSKRTDLPLKWTEVTQQDWSYGIPEEFSRVNSTVLPVLVQHYSSLEKITINFATHTTKSDLHEYILDAFILPRSGQVVAIKENDRAVRPIVAVQSVSSDTEMALDFFVQKNNTIYHMSCFGNNIALETNFETCFNVINTLRVK